MYPSPTLSEKGGHRLQNSRSSCGLNALLRFQQSAASAALRHLRRINSSSAESNQRLHTHLGVYNVYTAHGGIKRQFMGLLWSYPCWARRTEHKRAEHPAFGTLYQIFTSPLPTDLDQSAFARGIEA